MFNCKRAIFYDSLIYIFLFIKIFKFRLFLFYMGESIFKKFKPYDWQPTYVLQNRFGGWFDNIDKLREFLIQHPSYEASYFRECSPLPNPSLEDTQGLIDRILKEGPEDLERLGGWYVALDNNGNLVGFCEVIVSPMGGRTLNILVAESKSIADELSDVANERAY